RGAAPKTWSATSMQWKPRSSAAWAQSRIFAGSVPMSRVGKRAFSNIRDSYDLSPRLDDGERLLKSGDAHQRNIRSAKPVGLHRESIRRVASGHSQPKGA